jgi:hypothetical protein
MPESWSHFCSDELALFLFTRSRCEKCFLAGPTPLSGQSNSYVMPAQGQRPRSDSGDGSCQSGLRDRSDGLHLSQRLS